MANRFERLLAECHVAIASIAIGVLGGLAAFAFQQFVDLLQLAMAGGEGSILTVARELPWWRRLLLPAAGGLLGGAIIVLLARRQTPFGVTDLVEVTSLRRKVIRTRPTLARVASSAASIASGGSVGREGPILQLCATVGHHVATWRKADARTRAILIGGGVSAGMAAAYNAPLAGAVFALEVVLGNFALEVLGPVVLAAVSAALTMRILRGDLPLYDIHTGLDGTGVLPLVLALLIGAIGGVAARAFQAVLQFGEVAFARVRLPLYVRMTLGGLLVGGIGVFLPEVFGNGYDATNGLLHQPAPLHFLLLIIVFKSVATALTTGSGASGGVFTPTLLVGAAVGQLFAQGVALVGPGSADLTVFTLLGMAALLAGTTHAPIMSIALLLEATHELTLLVPLMLATTAAAQVARFLGRDSIYTEKLRARGVPVDAGIEELVLRQTTVGDIMRSNQQTVSKTARFEEVLARFQTHRRDILYVVEPEGTLLGLINLHDVKDFINDSSVPGIVIAADVMQVAPTVTREDTLADVLERFDERELDELPVVERGPGVNLLLGRVTRRDLLACLHLEVLRRQSLRARIARPDDKGFDFVELPRGQQLARLSVPVALRGGTLASLRLRETFGLMVIEIIESDADGHERRLPADPTLPLTAGHALLVMGTAESIERFRAGGVSAG